MGVTEEDFTGPELISPDIILAEHVELVFATPGKIGEVVPLDIHAFITFKGLKHKTRELTVYPVALDLHVARHLAEILTAGVAKAEEYMMENVKQQPSSEKPQED